MSETQILEPWDRLHGLMVDCDPEAIRGFFEALDPGEIARVLSRMSERDRAEILALLGPEDAAGLIEQLAEAQAADLLEDLPLPHAADILEELESDHRADLLGEMTREDAEAILKHMEPEEAEDARLLLGYDADTAGGIMNTEFVAYPQDSVVRDVVDDLRAHAEEYTDYGIHYVYVESSAGRLVGVVRMRDLLLSPMDRPLSQLMVVNPICVEEHEEIEDLNRLFDRYSFWSIPVTDEEGRMVGLAQRIAVEEAITHEQERSLMRMGGIISGEELRSMPLRERATRRLVWLGLNMTLSIMAASVILLFEGTINSVFALVFFMPVICNMCGCTGNQAVAVSIRELALGIVLPTDTMRVWAKEVAVGIIFGLVLGGVLCILSMVLWQETPMLGVVIGIAYALNTLIAVSLGGLLPLFLRRMDMDPALGAPPILTTLTDCCGFAMVLFLATGALSMGWLG
jgi:magnesium transporter